MTTPEAPQPHLPVSFEGLTLGQRMDIQNNPIPSGVMHGPYLPTENPTEQQDRQLEALGTAVHVPHRGRMTDRQLQAGELGLDIIDARIDVLKDVRSGDYSRLSAPARESLEAKDKK